MCNYDKYVYMIDYFYVNICFMYIDNKEIYIMYLTFCYVIYVPSV